MGRIRTTYIKRVSRKILKKHPEKLSKDFNKNKLVLAEIAEITSKKLRNRIAGCLVHLFKASEK